jgi:hypothetical protein
MTEVNEVVVLENVGGVDENIRGLSKNPIANLLDVENIHRCNVITTLKRMMNSIL